MVICLTFGCVRSHQIRILILFFVFHVFTSPTAEKSVNFQSYIKTLIHNGDVIMSTMPSQIISVSIICSTVCSGADQRKHQSFSSLAFVRGIHRWPEITARRASNAENVFIWWWNHHALRRHHANEITEGLFQVLLKRSIVDDKTQTARVLNYRVRWYSVNTLHVVICSRVVTSNIYLNTNLMWLTMRCIFAIISNWMRCTYLSWCFLGPFTNRK